MRFFIALFLLLPSALWAGCTGTDLRQTLAPQTRALIEAETAATPYAEGNHWIARRGSRTLHVIGTMHINDSRMEALAGRLAPVIRNADVLLMESSPADKAAFEAELGRDPSLILITEGPSLIDRLPPQEWAALEEKIRSHGMQPWMAAKMRPWFLAISMAFPPCLRSIPDLKRGLDVRLGEFAQEAGVPALSLEDPMTVIRMMDADPIEEQVRQMRAFLALLGGDVDGIYTMTESYFDEEALQYFAIYEQEFLTSGILTPEERQTLWSETMSLLVDQRNRDWIPVIEAADGATIAIAVGALHLPGDAGLLKLLEQQGYTLERAPF